MSTWPLAAKPLESRWFGVEELPEAEVGRNERSHLCFFLGNVKFNNMISWHRAVFGIELVFEV